MDKIKYSFIRYVLEGVFYKDRLIVDIDDDFARNHSFENRKELIKNIFSSITTNIDWIDYEIYSIELQLDDNFWYNYTDDEKSHFRNTLEYLYSLKEKINEKEKNHNQKQY